MAKALRTGRKKIPIHPVRVIQTKPTDEQVRAALKGLKRAAYDGDLEKVTELEGRLDGLLA